mmetsp:Transcript_21263/g.44351  ORF Transcript_21263/g.44351 Transcript_21263/m.44351 type:complete len:937 (+) Transcript_21263:168-2978(+)
MPEHNGEAEDGDENKSHDKSMPVAATKGVEADVAKQNNNIKNGHEMREESQAPSPQRKRTKEKRSDNNSGGDEKSDKSPADTIAVVENKDDALPTTPPPKKKGRKAKQTKNTETTPPPKCNTATEDSSNLEFTWICTECREAECLIDPTAPLLICDGKCNRPFHPPCANLTSIPPDDEPWICADCLGGRHQCAVCKEYGEDDVEVFCCDAKGCGLFFHENCLGMYESVEVTLVEEEVAVVVQQQPSLLAKGEEMTPPPAIEEDGAIDAAVAKMSEEEANNVTAPLTDNGAGSNEEDAAVDAAAAAAVANALTTTKIVSRPKFRCPAHECWTCSGGCPPQEQPMICHPVGSSNAAAVSPLRGDAARGGGGGGEMTPPRLGGKKSNGGRRGKKRKSGGAQASVNNLWGAKKERLFRCLECPTSYHITCMPPSCRFHELAMLCHEHAYTSKLPYLDAEYSYQASVEADAEKKIENLKRKEEGRQHMSSAEEEEEGAATTADEEENSFLPGLAGSAVLFEEDQLAEFLEQQEEEDDPDGSRKRKRRRQFNYCLPFDFKELVHSKPPAYTHVNMNRYDPKNRPKRHPPTGESCHCKPPSSLERGDDVSANVNKTPCGERCLNRLSYVECVGDLSLKNGDKNPYWNCNCGPKCGNRAMSQRKFAKCRPSREHGKGWGLITINGVKKGDLVQEYAGEIIDEKTKEKRLKEWSCDHPNDPNFYVMHLEPGWYIDAREVANMARFINHSCDPNCKLVPVNVAGHMRVSIICIKDVPPGGFLCYDYQFDTQHGEKFICRCGAKNCRGSMKGASGKTTEDVAAAKEKKSKKQLLSEAKARVQRDKKFLQGVYASEKDRLYLTGPFVPGVDAEKTEMVAGGPKERYRREARGVFLWRNANVGGDFSARYWKLMARKSGEKRAKPKSQNLAFQCRHLEMTVDVVSVVKG